MANYAYIRVSTDKQDLDNQRHGVIEYARKNALEPLHFFEDTASLFDYLGPDAALVLHGEVDEALQKFAADEFVDGFLKRPQHSLRFDEFMQSAKL